MASAQALSDEFIGKSADADREIDATALRSLHATLMENVLHGYDVLPSAVHLTASTLAMLAPEVAFRTMNLYVMPLGMTREMGARRATSRQSRFSNKQSDQNPNGS
jgi:hypothetical protein